MNLRIWSGLRVRWGHQQEHRPQRPTESSDPTQHAKGRTGNCPGPRKETTSTRNVTQGGQESSTDHGCISTEVRPTIAPVGPCSHWAGARDCCQHRKGAGVIAEVTKHRLIVIILQPWTHRHRNAATDPFVSGRCLESDGAQGPPTCKLACCLLPCSGFMGRRGL